MKKKFTALLLTLCILFGCIVPVFADQTSVADMTETEELAVDENMIYSQEAQAVEFTQQIKAKSAVLMDADSGKVLLALNENEAVYPASVTKIMSLLLICEAIDSGKIALGDSVTVSETAASRGGSQIWLEPGETMTVNDLLKATAVYSANDACTALGEHIAGSDEAFVQQMNEKAAQLGMTNTTFENCTGLDDTASNHLTTAYDVALMSQALLQYPFITDYTTIWMDTLRNGETEIVNTNKLIRFYNGATGLKTGTTEKAGCCVSASATRNGLNLIAVVMGSENSSDRFESAKSMLNWGFANYENYTPVLDDSLITEVAVLHGKERSIRPVFAEDIKGVLLKKGTSETVTQKVELVSEIEAPVEKGQQLGTLTVFAAEEVIAEIPLVADKEVEKLGFFSSLWLLLCSLGKEKAE
ncbi:MAG: D-alanyl-D-alanine carboxypeptidase [Clostridia bacterium]|nr:D-alanyl-D-alanine carboxypeptidase [Clostridia bacterium]